MPYDYFPGRSRRRGRAGGNRAVHRPEERRAVPLQPVSRRGRRPPHPDRRRCGGLDRARRAHLPQALGRARPATRPDRRGDRDAHASGPHGRPDPRGKNNYPNAELYIDRRDVTHWTDPAKRSGAPDYLQTSFQMAGRGRAPLPETPGDGRRAGDRARASPSSTSPAIHPAISACGSRMAGRASSWCRT